MLEEKLCDTLDHWYIEELGLVYDVIRVEGMLPRNRWCTFLRSQSMQVE